LALNSEYRKKIGQLVQILKYKEGDTVRTNELSVNLHKSVNFAK